MKLWVLPHIFKALAGYWSKLTSKSDALPLEPSLSTDDVLKPLPKESTEKKGKILKINLSEIPSESESSNSEIAPKNKRIHKKSKQAFLCKDKKKIEWIENEVKTNCRFMDESGEEISSIGERDGTDSELTVQDLMGELDPTFQEGRASNNIFISQSVQKENIGQLSTNVAEHPSNFVKHPEDSIGLFKKRVGTQIVNDPKDKSLRKALMIPVSRNKKLKAEKEIKEGSNSEINCPEKRESEM